jgi:hypothetical protein
MRGCEARGEEMSVKYYGDLASQPGEGKFLAVRILFCLIHFLLFAGNVVQAQIQATTATPPISVEDAFRSRKTRLFLVTRGAVIKLLSDDNKGDSHQRFILRTEGGTTVLVSHNIDVAERVPVTIGCPAEIRGEYIWNTRGGLLHWTHRDSKGLRAGGWIKLLDSGKIYR